MKFSFFEITTFVFVALYFIAIIWTIYRLIKSNNKDLVKFVLILLTIFLPLIGLISSLLVLKNSNLIHTKSK